MPTKTSPRSSAKPQRKTEQLRSRLAELRDEHEAVLLEGQIKAHRLLSSAVLREGEWGDRVSPTEHLDDVPDWYGGGVSDRISRATDHKNGDNYPYWLTETQHQNQRGISRHIVTTDEVAIGAVENHCNYVLGKRGMEFKVMPKDKNDGALATRAQKVIDSFLDYNKWSGVLERELVAKTPRDGELLIALEDRGGLVAEAIHLDPSFITEPDNPRDLEHYQRLGSLEWKYGIASEPSRPAKTRGAFCQWYGDENDWSFYPTARLIHGKLNVDRDVKRGMSDFYAVYTNLCRASKLFGNTMEGAAVQAAIAYIREHAPGVGPGAIRDFAESQSTDVINTPVGKGGVKRRLATKMRPGTVPDIPQGMKYVAGPLGQPRSTAYIEVMQAAMRRIGIRWTMPEYMISGDASNANFSSTLVSESPFVKAIEARQGWYATHFAELLMKVLMLKASVLGLLPRQVAERLKINVELPEVAIRDREKETRVRQIEYDVGLLSLETWASEVNRNLKDEQTKGARPRNTAAAPGAGEPGNASGGGKPTPETAPPPEATGGQQATAQSSQLNGAQMQAAISIVTAVAAGTMPRDAGIAQLMQFFNLNQQQADAMMGSAGTGQPTKPNPIPPAPGERPDLAATVSKAVTEAIKANAWLNYP